MELFNPDDRLDIPILKVRDKERGLKYQGILDRRYLIDIDGAIFMPSWNVLKYLGGECLKEDWRTIVKADAPYVFPPHTMEGPETWTFDSKNAGRGHGEIREFVGSGDDITLDGPFSKSTIATTNGEALAVSLIWTGNEIVVTEHEANVDLIYMPEFVSGEVGNVDATSLIVTMSKNMNAVAPPGSAFTKGNMPTAPSDNIYNGNIIISQSASIPLLDINGNVFAPDGYTDNNRYIAPLSTGAIDAQGNDLATFRTTYGGDANSTAMVNKTTQPTILLIKNETMDVLNDTAPANYNDVDGNAVTSYSIQPFESLVLIENV